MDKALIYTLGNSDITIKKGCINVSFGPRKELFRKLTLEARNEIKNAKDLKIVSVQSEPPSKGLQYTGQDGEKTVISLPMFPLVLNALKKNEFTKANETEYFIFYTNQSDQEHNSQDTLHLAEITKHFLMEMKVPESSIHLEKIGFNPTDTAKLMERFDSFIKENSELLPKFESVFLAMGPGTPQMGIASLFTFAKLENLKIYYLPRKKLPRRINILQEIKDRETIYSVLSLIGHYDYSPAYALYRDLYSGKEHLKLLESLYYRVSFEFGKAYDAIDEYFSKFQDKEPQEMREHLYKLKHNNEEALIKELYYEFALRILSERYMEAVGMVFRFQEEILKQAVEQYLKIKIIKHEPGAQEDFHQFKEKIRSNIELQKYLDDHKMNWESRDPNRYIYKTILKYAVEKDNNYPEDKKSITNKILEFDRDLEEKENPSVGNLLDLRNSTPFAHGFSGVSESRIKEVLNLGPTDLVEKFRSLLSGIGIEVERYESENFPFRKINTYIKKRLKQV